MKMKKPYDMPKLESPFIRKEINGKYILTPDITPGYEWVFEDSQTMAIEKLDGTNVSIYIQDGNITAIWNRDQRIPVFSKQKTYIIDGVINSYRRGYMEFLEDGQHFGEVIGVNINKNPYELTENIWIPFESFCQQHLKYKCWGKYPKTFESISNWFKELMPLYYIMQHGSKKIKMNDKEQYIGFVEGIIFTHPDGRMAKLRRDMFDWYSGKSHNID